MAYQSSEKGKVNIATEVTDKGIHPLSSPSSTLPPLSSLLFSSLFSSSAVSYPIVDGTHTKSSKKWDSDLASNSEEIVHAERKDAKKNQSIEEMQDNTVKKVQEKEKKLEGVDKKEVSDK